VEVEKEGDFILCPMLLHCIGQTIIKIYQSFFQSQPIMLGMVFDVFLFISTHILLVLFSPGSAEANVG